MKRSQFFKELSIKANLSEEVVRHVYYAMVKVMMAEIRKGEKIYLPDLGNFRPVIYQKKYVWSNDIEPTVVLKWTSCDRVKEYLRGLKNKTE